jgi:hypothetical protein
LSLGLSGTLDKIKGANGPAQIISYSFWGVLIAGMFYGIDPSCFPNWLITSWGAVSLAILPIMIWGSRSALLVTLLVDMVLSAYILALFFMHQPHLVEPVYMVNGINGYVSSMRNSMQMGHSVSEWFHGYALIWMSLHALYLANLTQRQILERKRFDNGH